MKVSSLAEPPKVSVHYRVPRSLSFGRGEREEEEPLEQERLVDFGSEFVKSESRRRKQRLVERAVQVAEVSELRTEVAVDEPGAEESVEVEERLRSKSKSKPTAGESDSGERCEEVGRVELWEMGVHRENRGGTKIEVKSVEKWQGECCETPHRKQGNNRTEEVGKSELRRCRMTRRGRVHERE